MNSEGFRHPHLGPFNPACGILTSKTGLGFRGLGFRGFGFSGLGFRGLGFRGLGFRVAPETFVTLGLGSQIPL